MNPISSSPARNGKVRFSSNPGALRSVPSNRGVALVIVLAFVVLLTGLVVAFFSRTMTERQVSDANADIIKAGLLAQGAADQIIGDLKQEIVVSSGTVGTPTNPVYVPLKPESMLPAIAGLTGNVPPNVLKVSGTAPFYPRTAAYSNSVADPRGSNIATTGTSLNGRSITLARWNAPLLLPKDTKNAKDDTDYTPMTTGSSEFVAPSWVLVGRDGSNPTSATDSSKVVGRYAYVIYHEGGLLDMNAVGYPTATALTQSAYKPSLAYADLKSIPGIGVKDNATKVDPLPADRITKLKDTIVGWRNYASSLATGTFASLSGNSYSIASGSNYWNTLLTSTTGFLRVSGSFNNGQSDRQFTSRQALIEFLLQGVASSKDERVSLQNALQYLGTFTRELNQPSYIPAVQTDPNAPVVLPPDKGGNSASGGDKEINPSFPATLVKTKFQRFDFTKPAPGLGEDAVEGEPLVKKRFALNRLAWVTYLGPSADRKQSDPDIKALIDDGIPWSYLQQGTAQNIENYFGLTWDSGNNRWTYDVHRGRSGKNRIIKLVARPSSVSGADSDKYVQDSKREPDFFELLKAGITVGSLGKAAQISGDVVPASRVPYGYAYPDIPANLRYNLDISVDYHIIQIGANILSSVNPTSYPVRIAFHDGSDRGIWEFQGVMDLPYLTYVFNGVLRTKEPKPAPNYSADGSNPNQCPKPGGPGTVITEPGVAYAVQVPAVWNPYDPVGTSGTLRPARFRVIIDSTDPVALANRKSDDPSLNHPIWCAGIAATAPFGGDNSGLRIDNRIRSFSAPANPTSTTGFPVNDSVTFTDENGSLYREPTLIFSHNMGDATRTAGNLPYLDNPINNGDKGPWAPLVLGQFPLAFQNSGTDAPVVYTAMGEIGHGGIKDEVESIHDTRVYFTYRLQYEYPANSNNWVTYDTKYGRTTYGEFSYTRFGGFNSTVIKGPDGFSPYSWASAIDPRTPRFGLIMEVMNQRRARQFAAMAPGLTLGDPCPAGGWIYGSDGALTTPKQVVFPIRPDHMAGFFFVNLDISDDINVTPLGGQSYAQYLDLLTWRSMTDVPFPSFAAGWTRPIVNMAGPAPLFSPGMYAQNNPQAPFYWGRTVAIEKPGTGTVQPSYYADADGVVRRAAGAYVPADNVNGASASTPVGLPPASIQGFAGRDVASLITPTTQTPYTQSQSRPLLLHRPFRTVSELGYVFRDVPWKNLDFFTPESGDAALLDLFCINETAPGDGLVAGKVNLNTRQAPVVSAIVSGAYIDDPKITNVTVGALSATLSGTIGNALTGRTAPGSNYGPLQNISELVGKWNSRQAISPPSGLSYTPVYAAQNSGIDLAASAGYMDGSRSYTGFSGGDSASSGTLVNLTDAYGTVASTRLKGALNNIKRFHEAPIRALAGAGQTRVWNLMIDVVAQTGRYPRGTTNFFKGTGSNQTETFIVEGEQRYWVHVAIDRLTGQVLDKQVEVVKE